MATTSLKFQIVETRLGGKPRFVARIPNPHNFDQAALVRKMVDLGTSVSRGEVESILALLQQAVIRVCSEGSTASLDGFVKFSPAIGGSFDSDKDGFQSPRNRVYVNATVSKIFKERFALSTSVERTTGTFKRPKVSEVTDNATDARNKTVTTGNIVTLSGEGLKFDVTKNEEFLHFVNDEDSNQHIAITKFQRRTDGELVFLMPKVEFSQGHFVVANAMNTATVRQERSKSVQVVA